MSGELISLADLLEVGRAADRPVAFDGADVRSWADFTNHVASLRDRIAASGARRWLVYLEDAYAFAAAILAVAHAGGIAVLPPNRQQGTLQRLGQDADGWLVQGDVVLPPAPGPVIRDPLRIESEVARSCGRLDPEAPFVEFFTSGTSGASKRFDKALRHLDDEVTALEDSFGAAMGDARVVATVSHQHIYGALFRILWPLAAGRPFSSRTYLHGSEVAGRLAERRSILVSSPVQLRAMADAGALAGLSPAAIFSSGAALDERTAREVAATTGTPVTEVFGSTETGGVAWRCRPRGGEVAWQPFRGVAVECDEGGRLSVTSRLVSVGEDVGGGRRRFCMGDRVEIASDGRFFVRGRVDRVVKIGSKRLSLPDMEAELEIHPWVSEAALVVLRRGLEARVCAAVVLSALGLDEHAERGRVETGRALAAALSAYFDRVLLPRVWRFVDQLPRTPQGKLPEARVQALFAPEADGPLDPIIETEEVDGLRVRRRCVVPEDLAFFAGHFDTFPIVPGVAQLRWVVDASRRITGGSLRIQAIDALKFHQPLLPGARFEIEVVADAKGDRLRFRLWRDDGEISSGRVVLARG